MPKNAKTDDPLIVALELLRRIPPKGRKITAGELHQQLQAGGISREKRTIERLLVKISKDLGVIERDTRSKPYGYCWNDREGGFVAPGLNDPESLLLTLAEGHLNKLLPSNVMESMQCFFEQARYDMAPGGKASRATREWLSKVRVVSASQTLIPAKVDKQVLAEVSVALYENRWLNVDYQNVQGRRDNYDVMPLGLAQQGPGMYLVCQFKGYDDYRHLALHRMRKARATTLGFKRPKDFDLKKYDGDGRFGFSEGKRVRLSFVIDKGPGFHLLETPLSEDQQVTEYKNSYRVTATVVDSGHLEWWLRSFGDGVRNVRRGRVT